MQMEGELNNAYVYVREFMSQAPWIWDEAQRHDLIIDYAGSVRDALRDVPLRPTALATAAARVRVRRGHAEGAFRYTADVLMREDISDESRVAVTLHLMNSVLDSEGYRSGSSEATSSNVDGELSDVASDSGPQEQLFFFSHRNVILRDSMEFIRCAISTAVGDGEYQANALQQMLAAAARSGALHRTARQQAEDH